MTSSFRLFPVSVGVLLLFGLAMLSTASALLGASHAGDPYFYLKRQLINGVLPGIALFFVASRFPYQKLRALGLPLMCVCVALLSLLFLPQFGITTKGATRWFDAGFLAFQPSELLKLSFILYLAALFAGRRDRKTVLMEGFVPFLIIMGVVAILLVSQPDLGTLGVISLTALSVYFAAGGKLVHIAIMLLIGLVGLTVFIYGFGYEYDRIMVYLDPSRDAAGSGYQIQRATAAIQSGSVFGIGFGESQRKFSGYLPEPMGDSIFAIIAEELGFIGVVFALSLFFFIGWQGFAAAARAPDVFGSLVATGITSWVLIQAFVNIGAISGMLPLTGIPLPFMSYGGTSLAVLLTACGIVYNIQRSCNT